MWILILALLLLGAQLNLSAIVPLQIGDSAAPWWVGGGLLWPFGLETRTLLQGDLLNSVTPILAIASTIFFLMATAALLRRRVPSEWFPWLSVAGVGLSIVLQVIWFSGWAIFPLIVDIALLWLILGQHVTVSSLRSSPTRGSNKRELSN